MIRGDLCAEDVAVGVVACCCAGPRPSVELAMACAGKPGWENTSHRYEFSDSGCANTPSSWDV